MYVHHQAGIRSQWMSLNVGRQRKLHVRAGGRERICGAHSGLAVHEKNTQIATCLKCRKLVGER